MAGWHWGVVRAPKEPWRRRSVRHAAQRARLGHSPATLRSLVPCARSCILAARALCSVSLVHHPVWLELLCVLWYDVVGAPLPRIAKATVRHFSLCGVVQTEPRHAVLCWDSALEGWVLGSRHPVGKLSAAWRRVFGLPSCRLLHRKLQQNRTVVCTWIRWVCVLLVMPVRRRTAHDRCRLFSAWLFTGACAQLVIGDMPCSTKYAALASPLPWMPPLWWSLRLCWCRDCCSWCFGNAFTEPGAKL